MSDKINEEIVKTTDKKTLLNEIDSLNMRLALLEEENEDMKKNFDFALDLMKDTLDALEQEKEPMEIDAFTIFLYILIILGVITICLTIITGGSIIL